MSRPPVMNVAHAAVTADTDGGVTFADPASEVLVTVWADPLGRKVWRITVEGSGDLNINAGMLGRLPITQMRYIAARHAMPNEPLYGMLATPKPPGGWGAAHWEAVLEVWRRGQEADGRGGGVRAVARLWGVTVDPTAYRWVRQARRLAPTKRARTRHVGRIIG